MWFRRKKPRQDPSQDQIRHVGRSEIRIGRFTYGADALEIREWGEAATLQIGRFCSIAEGVTIFLGGNHRTDWITTYPFGHIHTSHLGGQGISGHPATKGDVIIGNDVWIAAGATILSGVMIGNGAVIAAQSVVTRDVAAYSIAGGNPARPIAERFCPGVVSLLQSLAWWDLPSDVVREIAPRLSAPPTEKSVQDLIARYRPTR